MKQFAFLVLIVFAAWVAGAQVRPKLAISRSTNQTVVIDWPATNTGFVLQASITPAISNWQLSDYPPVFKPTDQVFCVSVPSTNDSGFYRLAPAPVAINLGTSTQIFKYGTASAMGLFNVPDMHTVVWQQSPNSYLLWITGDIGTNSGSVAMLSTTNFLNYQNAGSDPTRRNLAPQPDHLAFSKFLGVFKTKGAFQARSPNPCRSYLIEA